MEQAVVNRQINLDIPDDSDYEIDDWTITGSKGKEISMVLDPALKSHPRTSTREGEISNSQQTDHLDSEHYIPSPGSRRNPIGEVPHTPPRAQPISGTDPDPNLLSPSMEALQLGNPRQYVAELDSTPTTAVRQNVAVFQKRAEARSIRAWGKQRQIRVYSIGDQVSVSIPHDVRASTDDKRVLGKVINVFEDLNQYQIVTKWGVLDRMCPIDIVNPVLEGVDIGLPDPPPTTKVTLAYCARQQTTSQKAPVKCDCKDKKKWCKTRTCACIKAGVKCSIHCHKSMGHPDTREACPNPASLEEMTQIGLRSLESKDDQAHEKRQRQDEAGRWIKTTGRGFGHVDDEGKFTGPIQSRKKQHSKGAKRQLAVTRQSADDDDEDSAFRQWLQAEDPEEASLKSVKDFNRAHQREYEAYIRWKATAPHDEITAQKASFRHTIESLLNMGASTSAS